MIDPKKALHHHLSEAEGKFSVAQTDEAIRKASLGLRANNDPLEGNFGCFSEAFGFCRGMGIGEAAGQGQSRYYGDFDRGTNDLVSGKRSRAEMDGEDTETNGKGLFHDYCHHSSLTV